MIDISIDPAITAAASACVLIESAVDTALAYMQRTGSVGVLLTSEEEIQRLNREFRNTDRVTDVLSFPAWEGESIVVPPDGYLGDIAICMQRAAEQAELYGHSLDRELAFLAVHGSLHLMGYDHMVEAEELEMRGYQTAIMEKMGLKV